MIARARSDCRVANQRDKWREEIIPRVQEM